MKTRMIFTTGFVIGYYLGAKAGRQRYDQMNRLIGKARRSTPATMAGDKAKNAASDGFDRARAKVSHKLHHTNGNPDTLEFSPS